MESLVLTPSAFPLSGGKLRNIALFAVALFLVVLLMLAFRICSDGSLGKIGTPVVYRLIFAAWEGNTARIVELKKQGVTISDRRSDSAATIAYTPLMGAALNGRDDIIELLLGENVQLDRREWFGHTALMLAVKSGRMSTVRKLLEAEADVHVVNVYGHTALMFAAMRGRTDMAGLLLDAGADVNAVDKFGWPVLQHAAQRGHVETVKFLLARGARPLG